MYIIVKRFSLKELVLVVNCKIQQGLITVGGLLTVYDDTNLCYAQAMELKESVHEHMQKSPGKYVHTVKELQCEFDALNIGERHYKSFPTDSVIVIEPDSILTKKTLGINRNKINNISALHMLINIGELC